MGGGSGTPSATPPAADCSFATDSASDCLRPISSCWKQAAVVESAIGVDSLGEARSGVRGSWQLRSRSSSTIRPDGKRSYCIQAERAIFTDIVCKFRLLLFHFESEIRLQLLSGRSVIGTAMAKAEEVPCV